MKDLNLEPQLNPPSPLDTPPQGTEQEVVLPVAEEVIKPAKKSKKSQPKRTPPQVKIDVLTEEQAREVARINKKVIERLGSKRHNSYLV